MKWKITKQEHGVEGRMVLKNFKRKTNFIRENTWNSLKRKAGVYNAVKERKIMERKRKVRAHSFSNAYSFSTRESSRLVNKRIFTEAYIADVIRKLAQEAVEFRE